MQTVRGNGITESERVNALEKEKGIICEEINMLKDNPEWFAEEEMQRMLYQKHSFRQCKNN